MSDRYTIVTMAFVAGINARRLHGAAQGPNKPASRHAGIKRYHATRRDRAMKKYLVTDPRKSAPLHRSANTARNAAMDSLGT